MSEISIQDVENLIDAKLANILAQLETRLDDIEDAFTDATSLSAEAAENLVRSREILDTHSTALHGVQETQDNHTTMLAVLTKLLGDGHRDIMAWHARMERTDIAVKYLRKKLKLHTKKLRRLV